MTFLDEVLTRSPEKTDQGLSDFSMRGLGYICRLCQCLIGKYRTDVFNSIDHLQRLMRDKAKVEETGEAVPQ